MLPWILSSLLFASALPAEEPLKSETRQLTGFEIDSGSAKTNACAVSLVAGGATEGTRALEVKFDSSVAYPGVKFEQVPPADFRGYGGLAFDVYNPGSETVGFAVRIDSSPEADGNGNHSRTGKGTIDGGQRASYVLPFGVDPTALKMVGIPGYEGFRNLGYMGAGPFDIGHIVAWQIFQNRPSSPQTLIIDNVRLLPGRKPDFAGIIDRYGQYSREDWPGKVKSDGDFAAQLAAEDRDLAKVPTGRDKFGGWADGPRLEATGFFRVAKHDGKWAFVDPEGRLFLSVGPTTVSAAAPTTFVGREDMFSALPANDPALAPFLSDKGLDFLSANLQKKYGGNFKQAWLERTYQRLASWGFNTIAAFSTWDTINNGRIPYTLMIWVGGKHAKIPPPPGDDRPMSDPFDPQFAADVAAAVQPQASRAKDDPYCIGYFIGNEEKWGSSQKGPRHHYGLVMSALKLPAAASSAKRAFLEQLQKQYGDIGKLNEAWGTSYPQWSSMEGPLTFKDPLSPGLLADFSKLLTSLAEQYFRTVSQELKKADPNHLDLGCRFAGYSPEILGPAAKYCDALSFNVYRSTLDPVGWKHMESYNKPFLVGEFHFGATDRGVFDGGLIGVADQKARGQAYQKYLRSALALPGCIGTHWFQYTDQPTTGRPGDGENGNIGFVSITDTPYPELIGAAREMNSEMYSTRFGQ